MKYGARRAVRVSYTAVHVDGAHYFLQGVGGSLLYLMHVPAFFRVCDRCRGPPRLCQVPKCFRSRYLSLDFHILPSCGDKEYGLMYITVYRSVDCVTPIFKQL